MKRATTPRGGFAILALVFGLCAGSTAAYAQNEPMLSSGQTLYLPIYSHMLYGNVGKRRAPSHALLSALVSIRNTDARHPLRVSSARYYDTNGKLLGERVPQAVAIPPYGTHEIFVDQNDASGGSGANFVIEWSAEAPINPPLVESLHANLDGGKAIVFTTQATPVAKPAAPPQRQ